MDMNISIYIYIYHYNIVNRILIKLYTSKDFNNYYQYNFNIKFYNYIYIVY